MTVFAFVSQLDPSLEAKVNAQKQSVMLEEEYEVSRGGRSNHRISYFPLFQDEPSKVNGRSAFFLNSS